MLSLPSFFRVVLENSLHRKEIGKCCGLGLQVSLDACPVAEYFIKYPNC
jgi:hypothetical protein